MITHAVTRQGSTAATVHAAHRPAWAIVTLIVGVVAALAIASSVALLLAIGLAACHAAIETPAARRLRAERAARAQRRTRHEQRERRVEAAGADADELRQLAEIVDRITGRGLLAKTSLNTCAAMCRMRSIASVDSTDSTPRRSVA